MDLQGEKPSLPDSFGELPGDESSLPLGHPRNVWDIDEGESMSMDMLNPDHSSLQAGAVPAESAVPMLDAAGANSGLKRPADADEGDGAVKKAKLNNGTVAYDS